MSAGLFTDKAHRPTDDQIRDAIGPGLVWWDALVDHVRTRYSPQEDFRFMYGKSYGWALRFRSKGRLLTALYPTEGGLTAQVILDPRSTEAALAMDLGGSARDAIERANPYAEGRWLFVPVRSQADLGDVQRLVALRAGGRLGVAPAAGAPETAGP